mgnify:CR=1 FL=1
MWRITALILCLALNSQVSAEIIEIHSLDEMDDQRGFCIDVRGHKSKAKINSGLQAHTCYSYQGSIAVDQGFDSLKMGKGQFYLPAFDVCMEATANAASALLILSKCQDVELQKFKWGNNGRIYLISNVKLCLTIAQGKSRQGGGGSPKHLIRNLSLEFCDNTQNIFQMWGKRSGI